MMKCSPILLAIVAFTAAGCGGTTVRESKERVIEKQIPVVETRKEVVVQPAPVTREVIIQSPTIPPQRSCAYSSATFFHGTLSCQSGDQVRCEDGRWVRWSSC
jgi:hypothetical protein